MDIIMEEMKVFIKPELVILIPVLYIVGKAVKNTKIVHESHIPFILGILGIFLSSIYAIGTSELNSYRSLLMCIFMGVTQGITSAGLSVYTNQMIEVQPKDRKRLKDENDANNLE